MITKLSYDNQGNFNLIGSIKVESVDFEKQTIDFNSFLPLISNATNELKKNIYKQLADDNKILGDERVEVVRAIDKFLTLIFCFAFVISNEPFSYSKEYGDNFRIDLRLSSTKNLSGSGKLCNVSSKDIIDYEPWIEEKIIGVFKNLIGLFSGQSDKDQMEKELIKLIYNSLALRYKIEYI